MTNIHLLVLIHGMWGNPAHIAELERIARETYALAGADGTVLHVLKAESIRDNSTYDGVDWGGERVAKEVTDAVKDLESKGDHVTRFSVTGYSLGGLIARYLIGILYHAGFFENITPVNFNTIATPHAGLPRYLSLFSSLSSVLGPRLLSRTGEQFYCADKWSSKGRPLLVVMADPNRIFHQSLSKFQHIRIYANSVNDITVPFVTAAIELSDPFVDREATGIQLDMDKEYSCLIRDYTIPSTPPPKSPSPAIFSADWFRQSLPRPVLPPVLQFRFPFNLLLYTLLPVLIPVFISLAIVRLSLATRSSRARIKQLEKEAYTAGQEKLADILDELEREVEEAVVDLIDNPDPSSSIYQASNQSSRGHPIITANHKKIVNWLNLLPIKKEITYFPDVRNSHAMIVCRDIKRFEFHRQGEVVLRHWANSFIL
ncbi:DUF676-domain-containing protein [Phlegmacium glaucopus]|nr:DUF676-domain-containing protein [Phlegmacium glaucopus]